MPVFVIYHLTRATRHLIFWSLIAIAVSLSGVRLLLSGIESYKSNLASNIEELVGAPVEIGRLGAKMRGFSPELVLEDITILSPGTHKKPPIQFNEIRLGINLLDMVINRQLLSSSWVTLVGAKLTVIRKPDGSFAIVGLKASDGQPLWLMEGGKYEVLRSEISWQDEKNHSQPLIFNDVDLAIINAADARHHRINMLMKLPPQYGDALKVSMDLESNVFESTNLHGTAFIEGSRIKLAEWDKFGLPLDMQIDSGIADFKAWAKWQNSLPVSVIGEAQIQQAKLARKGKGAFPVDRLRTRFQWQAKDNQWRLDVKDFWLETADAPNGASKKWPAADFSVSGDFTEDNLSRKLAVFVEQLDLHEASGIIGFFAPLSDQQSKALVQARPRGLLENFSAFADLQAGHFAVNGRFAGISMAPQPSIPGLENLAGHIKGTEQGGIVRLMTERALLTSPELFRNALSIDSLSGIINWRQTESDWTLASSMVRLDNADFQSENRLRIVIPKADGQVFMDLQSAFVGHDISQAKHYLPVGIMGKSVVDWLDHAFIGGRIKKGGMLFYGNPGDFPFKDGSGVFETLFEAEQAELAYHPEWPHITDMAADVLFLKDGLLVDVKQGRSDKASIKQAQVAISSMQEIDYLQIKGQVAGEIGQILGFMQQTPLHSTFDALQDVITPAGHTEVALDLQIPLMDTVDAKVDGTAQLNNAQLTVNSLDLPVKGISGALKFNEQGLYSDTINAAALGHAIRININSDDSQTMINVSGHAGVDDLQAQFKMPWWDIAEGETDYQLQLRLPYSGNKPDLTVQSTLAGIVLDLPDTLAKSVGQERPLLLRFELTDEALLPIQLNYDNKLKAAISLNAKQQRIHSGHVLVGAGEATLPREAGLELEINRDRLDLPEWLSLSTAAAQGQENDAGATSDIREIKIHSDRGVWKKTELGVFDLALKRNGDYWAGDISSSFARGNLQVPVSPKGGDSIKLNMDVLDISALRQLRLEGAAVRPEQVPLLNITSRETLWHSTSLGQLLLETERIPEGIRFKRAELLGADEKLTLSGTWSQHESQIIGRLETPHWGRLLARLGVTDDMTETSGVMHYDLRWQGAPFQFSLAGLNGQVDVNLKNGRILSIEPGFGRVLGMLAMAQWVKRIQLDFSDVYEEGLTFNSIKGHFDLLDGLANTHDLVVDAVPAKITIRGDTDLVNGTIDHNVNVVPKSSEAVPIAGTIVGKIAGLVARSLTGEDKEGFFFGSQYRLKGEWRNAEIIPLHENDGLLQKTWNGITDFPWLEQRENNKENQYE
ncbi:YhdP family protein [Methylobacter sp. Wu1]|uniref:YhdP family protein n=1 Tax=Methylobacter sp. Wu1 TaxID=3119359 RepID=UPI002F953006